MNKVFFSCILLLSVATAVFAEDEQTITLKDGSQIKGVLTKVENGIYTVKTPIIGDVHVAIGDVSTISNGPAATPLGASTGSSGPVDYSSPPPPTMRSAMDQQIESSQKQILSDPQSVAILQQMAENPEIMRALQDPELVRAVSNHDYAAVQGNPAVQKLMNDPQFHALLEKLASQQRQSGS